MSDEPFFPQRPPLMSAIRARNLARIYRGFAIELEEAGDTSGARLAGRNSQWWMNYAIALSQIPPGAIDDNDQL